jgi:subtilisin-like proprotein convertase family protein
LKRIFSIIFIYLVFSSSAFPIDFFTSCRNGLNKPILDHQTTLDTIIVALPPDSRILDVNIRIDTVLHTYDSDLRFYLRHLGTGVSFIRNVGQGGDNFLATNIDDSASCAIGSSGCNLAPFSGTFKPTSPANLVGFNYQQTNGLWVLAVTDTFSMDQGILKAWCITIIYDNLLSAENNNGHFPSEYFLHQNYPNPFNASSKFKVQSSKFSFVTLSVYDILGREIAILLNDVLKPGTYEFTFDGTDYPGGVYFYRLETDGFSDTKKMLLLK